MTEHNINTLEDRTFFFLLFSLLFFFFFLLYKRKLLPRGLYLGDWEEKTETIGGGFIGSGGMRLAGFHRDFLGI